MRKLLTIAFVVTLLPTMVFGAVPEDADVNWVKGVLEKVAGYLFDFAMLVGIVCVLWAAFQYMTAGGSSEKVGEANKIMLYAVIGLVVALLASGVPALVNNLLSN